MRIVFEISKLVFLLIVLAIGILQYQGETLLDQPYQTTVVQFLLPAFFIFGGVMLGWILALFFSDQIDPPRAMLVRGFVIGLSIGMIASLLYLLGLLGPV